MLEFREVTTPYPGLRSFQSWEAEIFFGRDAHTNRLLEILQRERLLAVIGPSGSGKSSLVRAGLLPALALGSLGTAADWRVATMQPGNRPLRNLARALTCEVAFGGRALANEESAEVPVGTGTDVALVEAELRRGPLGLVDLVAQIRRRRPTEASFNLLVLVDQFEELFTFAGAGDSEADESEALVNLLLAAKAAPSVGIYVVFTMRTDFLGSCVRFLELPDAINRAQFLTPRLTRLQIQQVITGPAQLFGGNVDAHLVPELINSVTNDPDQLPLLQHALARMWQLALQHNPDEPMLGWREYTDVGGVAEALSRHAKDVFLTLSQLERECTEWLFRAITEQRSAETGGQAVRRPQSLGRIAEWTGRYWSDFVPVVQAFARDDVNFLHFDGELMRDTVVDISHEALIRQWKQVHDWVADESQRATEYRHWLARGEAYSKKHADLLIGAELARAVEWLEGGPVGEGSTEELSRWRPTAAWARRYERRPGGGEGGLSEVIRYIAASHKVLIRRQALERKKSRRLLYLLFASVFLLSVSIGLALHSYSTDLRNQATSFWHPLSFEEGVSTKEREALLRLSRSDNSVRETFLAALLEDESLARHFNKQPDVIMEAAVGTSLRMRQSFLARLKAARFDRDAGALERHEARSLALVELGAPLPLEQLADVVSRHPTEAALRALSAAMEHDTPQLTDRAVLSMLDRLSKTVDASVSPQVLIAFRHVLDALIHKVTLQSHYALSSGLLDAMTWTFDRDMLQALSDEFSAAGQNLTPEESEKLAKQIISSISASTENDQRVALGRALIDLIVRLPADQMGVLTSLASLDLSALLSSTDPGNMAVLGRGLAAIIATADHKARGEIIGFALTGIRTATEPDRVVAITASLTKVAEFHAKSTFGRGTDVSIAAALTEKRMETAAAFVLGAWAVDEIPDETTALKLSMHLVSTVVNDGLGDSEDVASALQAACALLSAQDEQQVIKELKVKLFAAQTPSAMETLLTALAAVNGVLSPAEIDALLEKIESTSPSSDLASTRIGTELTTLAPMLSQTQTTTLYTKLLAYRKSPALMNAISVAPLIESILNVPAAVAANLTREDADRLAKEALDYMDPSRSNSSGESASPATSNSMQRFNRRLTTALLTRVSPDEAASIADRLFRLNTLANNPDKSRVTPSPQAGRTLNSIGSAERAPSSDSWTGGSREVNRNLYDVEFAAAAARLSPVDGLTLARRCLVAIQETSNPTVAKALQPGLKTLASRLQPEQAESLWRQLAELIRNTSQPFKVQVFASTLLALSENLGQGTLSSKEMFHLLANPLVPRAELSDAIRAHFADAPDSESGFWAFAQWANKKFPGLELEAGDNLEPLRRLWDQCCAKPQQ